MGAISSSSLKQWVMRPFYWLEGADLTLALYRAVLGREPDPDGLANYGRRIKSAKAVGKAVAGILGSVEYHERIYRAESTDLTYALYRAVLAREPELDGLEQCRTVMRSAQDVGEVAAHLLDSDEFRERLRQAARARSSEISLRDLTEEKLVFLHLPKTGGTTLRHVLAQGFAPEQICPEAFNRLQHYTAGELARYRLFSGHFDLPSTRLIPGHKAIVTMVREPMARLLSLFFFQKAHPLEISERDQLELPLLVQRYSVDEFFAAPEIIAHPTIDNAFTRTLTQVLPEGSWATCVREHERIPAEQLLPQALAALESLSAVGVLERFEESARVICARARLQVNTRIKPQQVLHDLIAATGEMRPIRQDPVTERTRALLAPLVATDRVLYRRAVELLDAQLLGLEGVYSPSSAPTLSPI